MRREIKEWRWIVVALEFLVFWGLITACNFNVRPTEPSTTPDASETAEPTTSTEGSISGLIWEDLCINFDDSSGIPIGCVESSNGFDYLGNGLLEAGEAGVQAAQVKLGVGVCPSDGLAIFETGVDGRYTFFGLPAGEYCLSVTDPKGKDGIWTFPKTDNGVGVGRITVSVGDGESVENVNFGYDPIEIVPTPEPTAAPTSPPCTDEASYVRDVSVPDGTRFDPGDSFTKTWRLRNEGTCTWSTNYSLVFISGYSMQGPAVTRLLGQVPPGSEVDITLPFQAPMQDGEYAGFWKLRNSDNVFFGIGISGESPIWVQIMVGQKPEPEITEWRGEYYDNVELKGDPLLVRNDEEIDFNWKSNSPDADVPKDQFAVRWSRTVEFKQKIYRFHLIMDDGATLWVDDQLVIDEWKQGASREVTIDLEMKKGEHDIKVEYFEAAGTARVAFWWEILDEPLYGGWKGTYWFNRTLDSAWGWVRDDVSIDFDWKYKSPALGIPADDFSASWEKSIEFETGVYTFYAQADDGLRVYIDDALVIDEWHNSDGSELYETELELSGMHEISIQYYERKQYATVHFWWIRNNEAPVTMDDAYEVNENTLLQVDAAGVLENDSDAEGDSLTALLEADVANGTLTLNDDGSFEYMPVSGFFGEDQFQYRANDGREDSDAAVVTITVIMVNQAPEAIVDTFDVSEDNVLTVPGKGVLENDSDQDGDSLTAVLETEAENGILELNVDGSFIYTPHQDFNGIDTFTYRANDGYEDSDVVTVTIMITAVNDIPEAVDDEAEIENGDSIEIDVLQNDRGVGDRPLELTIESEPEDGSVKVSEGQIIYTPKGSFLDVDSFTYRVTDVDGESTIATVVVTRPVEGFLPLSSFWWK